MGEKVLVVGGGGREHAIAWALARSSRVDAVIAAPGNPGIAAEPHCRTVDVAESDLDGIVELARQEAVDLVVVGPEDPLVAGLVDRLAEAGIAAFGPSAAVAQLEGSKSHCKEFLLRNGIPTGAAVTFDDADAALAHLESLDEVPVVKADGLAAGKGVIVAATKEKAAEAIREILVEGRFGPSGDSVLLEERLTGTEVSILAFCDGADFRVMPPAQDHKRLLSGDEGPNTGGMGAFHPSPIADDAFVEEVSRDIIAPTLAALIEEGRPYRGVLYVGLMVTDEGPKVIEYNCRFGDPETQVVLPLLETDIYTVLEACATGSLADIDLRWSDRAAVTVVMASGGYPASSRGPVPIEGIDLAVAQGCIVFHAGTALIDDVLHTSGGRVLAVTAIDEELATAAEAAHAGVKAISFEGAQHRGDIARGSLEPARAAAARLR